MRCFVVAVCLLAVLPHALAVVRRLDAGIDARVFARVMLGARDADQPVTNLPDLGADKNQVIRVCYLEAPLFKSKYGNAAALINGFHGGVGFCVVKDGKCAQEFAVEYNAKNGVASTLMPVFENNEPKQNADGSLVWSNEAEEVFLPTIDMSYWTKRTEIANITGDAYAEIRQFILGDLAKFPRYKLFFVKGQDSQTHSEPSTCVDFVWRILGLIAKKVCLKRDQPPQRDYVVLSNTNAKKELVDAKEARDWFKRNAKLLEEIKLKLHNAVQLAGKLSLKRAVSLLNSAMKKLAKVNKGEFFVYESDKQVVKVKLDASADFLKLEYDVVSGALYNPFADVSACK